MAPSRTLLRHTGSRTACLLAALLLSQVALPVAWAEPDLTTLKNAQSPLSARVKTPLHMESAKEGSPFTACLDQAVAYQTGLLPAGSYLVGELERVRPSRRFGRPGYFQIRLHSLTYPDGQTVSLSADEPQAPRKADILRRRVYHPKAQRAGGLLKNNLASSTVGAATTVTLTAVGTFAMPYALGARVVAGALYEGFAGDKSRGPLKRLAIGGFRGTGLPGIYHFLRKQPAPVFELDDPIALTLGPVQTQALFAQHPNPEVSWRNAGFYGLDWTQPQALHAYADLARQLSTPPPQTLAQEPPAAPSSEALPAADTPPPQAMQAPALYAAPASQPPAALLCPESNTVVSPSS